jgi:hypothetical protein
MVLDGESIDLEPQRRAAAAGRIRRRDMLGELVHEYHQLAG